LQRMMRWPWWKTRNGNGNGHAKALKPGEMPLPAPPEETAEPALPPEPPWVAQWDKLGLPHEPNYPTTTLARMLDQTADRFGQNMAVVFNHTKRWTYKELQTQVNRLAGGLASLGVRKGERVVVTLPNCPEYVLSFFAIQKLGAVVVNTGPLMGADDVRNLIAMTSPRVVIGLDLQTPMLCRAAKGSTVEHWLWVSLSQYQPVLKRLGYQFKLWHEHEDDKTPDKTTHTKLEHLMERAPARPPTIEPDPDSIAVLQPTGGTTGTLKVAQLSHRNLLANATQVVLWMGNRVGQERVLAVLPMFHVYGLTTCLMASVFSGSEIILMTRFNTAQVMEVIRKYRPTVFPLVPAICEAISNDIERVDTPSQKLDGLRLCISGAAPLPQVVAERFERLTGSQIIEGYGLSEASPVTHVNVPGAPRHGSIGLPLPGTKVRVVDLENGTRDLMPGDVGEMLISGPQVMSGYFANPEQSAIALSVEEDGRTWLHTGDAVRYDEDGYFYVMDRKKDMIIRSGLKVYPAKVEKVLRTHKLVSDACVVGRADTIHTEIVVAVVVLSGASEEIDKSKVSDELRALCREHLAPYEVPAQFEFVAQLPRSPLGKLLRRELRDRVVQPQPTTSKEVA